MQTCRVLLCGLLAFLQLTCPAASAAEDVTSQFKVPEGYLVERVAAPPLVEYPMCAGFDERGRLFVAENAGVNLKFEELLKDPPSRVVMLEDTDSDGTFDKRTVFADKLTFPTGALWHRGALYVCSAPNVWKLEDTDGDNVADKRTAIVTGFHSTGNGADLHGPFLGPEGWLYFTNGRNGHDVTLGDGTKWTGKAACLYRCRTDGSGLEVVFGGGFDNPVEVAFTPEGEPLVNVNILHAQPQRMDAIVYGIEGGNYPHDAAYRELPWTGSFLPPAGELGWVATSGFMRYRGRSLPGFNNRYFTTEFNTRKVRAHHVERDGAGFKITNHEFLGSDNPDFHPSDVLEDADGSLLFIDTGAWFRIGCPASKVAKPEVKGAIYRVRFKDAKKIDDPWGIAVSWREVEPSVLVERLRDPRPTVADRAVFEVSNEKNDMAQHLLESWLATDSPTRIHGIWALAQSDSTVAQSIRHEVGRGYIAPSQHAAMLRAFSLTAAKLPAATVIPYLRVDSEVAREAATLLGRSGAREAVVPLLDSLSGVDDVFLQHAITFALIRVRNVDETVQGLRHQSPRARRAALTALQQMPGGNLTADLVTPHLASEYAPLRETALSIATQHPEWAEQIVPTIRASLAKPDPSAAEIESLRAAVVAFAKSAAVQGIVAELLNSPPTSKPVTIMLLDSIGNAGVTPLPEAWLVAIKARFADADSQVVRHAVDATRSAGGNALDADLLKLARDVSKPADVRVAALAVTLPRAKSLEPADFQLLTGELAPKREPLARLAAAQALAAAPLTDAQLVDLAHAMAVAGPLELPALMAAFERSGDTGVGLALVESLKKAKSLAGLTAAGLTQTLAKYPASVRDAAAPLLAKINPDAAAQQARLAELEPTLTAGDATRGKAVFFGKASACATCHAVAGQGASVGPDLTKIASIRSPRDLLESVVFPSNSFARGYESFVVQTKDNQLHAGVLTAETPDAIVIRTPAETRVPRANVKSMRQDRVSIMPQGLDEQMSREELADLMAYLQSLK